jgi:anaphase-promoting complex subunit 1
VVLSYFVEIEKALLVSFRQAFVEMTTLGDAEAKGFAQHSRCDPLKIRILADHGAVLQTRGHWNIHARFVTLHPVLSNIHSSVTAEPFRHTIKTIWEVDAQNSRHQRIAIYSGPECPVSRVLIALKLPESAIAPPQMMHPEQQTQCGSVFAWVNFRNQEKGAHNHRYSNNPLLCCLINRNSICFWDVFPKNEWNSSSVLSTTVLDAMSRNEEPSVGPHLSIPSEGCIVPLPFDCDTIVALDSGGLLLQRMEDHEDHALYSTMQERNTSSHNEFGSLDDGFVLLGPPSTWKHRLQQAAPYPSSSPRNVPSSRQQPSPMFPSSGANTLPTDSGTVSLFTLHHPLDDVLPVMLAPNNKQASSFSSFSPQFTDVFEQVIWIGTAEWINEVISETQLHGTKNGDFAKGSAQLMVTYHTIEKRHAIWMVDDAPEPPKVPPLHEQTRNRFKGRSSNSTHKYGPMRDTVDLLLDDNDFPMKNSLDVSVNVGLRPPHQSSHFTSRDVALADALGVHRLSTSPRSGGLRQQRHQRVLNSDMGGTFTPSSQMPMDVSHGSIPSLGGMSSGGSGSRNFSLSPGLFSTRLANSLHPKVAVQCLYTEDEHKGTISMERSRRIFLISNFNATGTLVLCLLCGDALTLYSLLPECDSTRQLPAGSVLKIQHLKTFSSVTAALPILACPAPLRLSARKQRLPRQSADLLVLKKNGICTLFRSSFPIIDCVLPERISSNIIKIIDLSDSVGDCFSMRVQNEEMIELPSLIRCQLSLSFETASALADMILSCIETTLYSDDNLVEKEVSELLIQKALCIRVDCCRLFQSLQSQSLPLGSPTSEGLLVEILKTVVFRILQYELCGRITFQKIDGFDGVASPAPEHSWETLLSSDFHGKFKSKLELLLPTAKASVGTNAMSKETNSITVLLEDLMSNMGSLSTCYPQVHCTSPMYLFSRILDSVHLLYEDSKLSSHNPNHDTLCLGAFLLEVSEFVASLEHGDSVTTGLFLDYYRNEMSETNIEKSRRLQWFRAAPGFQKKVASSFKFTSFSKPPSILSWLQAAINHNRDLHSTRPIFGGISDWKKMNFACARTRLVLRVFLHLDVAVDCPEKDARIVHILLEEGFHEIFDVQERLCSGVSLPLLEVLHRCRNNASRADVPGWTSAAWTLAGRHDLGMNLRCDRSTHSDTVRKLPFSTKSGHVSFMQDDLNDGLVELEYTAAMYFSDDNRVHEAARLLCSARPLVLRVARPVEVSDHDFERIKQKQLLILCWRSLALPTGRGMLTIGRFSPIPAETLPIPELCLKGKVPPYNATLNLDTSECSADMMVWPEFHNGVASGLRLLASDDCFHANFTISRTWITYNRPLSAKIPPTPPPDNTDDPSQSGQGHSHSHGGFLLALGLRGHLIALEMSDIYEYLTQGCATTTVGVLLGLAVNKRGSCDLAVSKMLCLHIPSLIPQHFNAIDVAGVVQTAAVVGAGFLYQGSFHRMMTEFLLNEIGKRPDADINTTDREAYALSCGLALGLVNLCLGEATESDDRTAGLSDLHIEERLIRYIVGGVDKDEAARTRETNDRFSLPNSVVGNDSEKCSTIFESELINTSVTSPGATLALGFIYMKTNNKVVADSLALPDTHFLLEFVRPDYLGLRVISRSLILWDDVEASKVWITEQIPSVVRNAYQHMRASAKSTFSVRSSTPGGGENPSSLDMNYDSRAIQQIYVHVVAAACFALGLRFAGTASSNAKGAIMERLMELHSLREASDPVSVAVRPEIPILESCLGCAAISLAMVLAGTGDLDALRVFKVLRWRADNDSQYGIHMIFAMSIGLLFVGGGACTLGRCPEDIAALVIAFFPRFPVCSWDNQYHLQALRHVYALAVKRSELRAVDVDTKENVSLAVKISNSDLVDPLEYRAPCLLPNTENSLLELRVLSDKYYPLTLKLSRQSGVCVFFVKRRHGHSTHSFAPPGVADVKGNCRNGAESKAVSLGRSLFRDAFAEYFSSETEGASSDMSADPEFLSRVLCVRVDDDSVLPLLWHLRYSAEFPNAAVRWNLRLIQAYYEQRKHSESSLMDTQLLLPYLLELADPAGDTARRTD